MKKMFFTSLLLCACLTGGCAQLGHTAGKDKDIAGVSLQIVTPFGQGDGYQRVYQELLQGFQEESGVIIDDVSERSSEAWKMRVLESFENGTEPDVLFFFAGTVADKLVDDSKVVDIDTIRQYKPEYAVNINLSVFNTMKAFDTKNYCVPVTGFWEGMYINQDLFDQYDVKVPENEDELFSAVEAFRANGIIPVSVNLCNTPHYWFEYLVYDYTGPSYHFESVDDQERILSDWHKGLDLIKRLYEAGAFPEDIESVTDDRCTALFNNKEAAMMLDGSWAAGSITDTENVRVVHVPSAEGGRRKNTDIIGGYSMGYYITQKAWDEKRDAAIALVEALTNENALTVFNANGSASPGPKSETDNESAFLLSINDFIGSSTAYVPAVQDTFAKEAREYLFSEIINIAQGKSDIDAVLESFMSLNVGE